MNRPPFPPEPPPNMPREVAKQFSEQVKEDVSNVVDFIRRAAGHVRGVSERAERIVSRCGVCLDQKKVGAAGHEVDCPACVVRIAQIKCQTCQDSGMVGYAPSQIACPVCRSSSTIKGHLR